MTLKSNVKFEEKLPCGLENNLKILANFHQSIQKSKKFALWWAAFDQSITCLSQKCTEELFLTALHIDAKFEGKLTCAFKNDMRNLANFYQSAFESQKIWTFVGSFYPK